MAGIRDVAKRANVSAITVSRVINSPEIVSQETIDKVTKVMKELNYSINPVARALATNKTNVISVYIPKHIDINNLYVMELISGISEVCSTNLYSMLIVRKKNAKALCDGYILTGIHEDEMAEMIEFATEKDRKFVLFGNTEKADVDYIDADNFRGAEQMVMHLIENGHKKIGMIKLKQTKVSRYGNARYEGYLSALKTNGLNVDPTNVFEAENTVDASFEMAKEMLNKTDVTAFFCATDVLAMGLMRACQHLNISIPEQISIGSFDGFGHQNMMIPHITTMKQPIFEIGKKLATTLLNKLKDEKMASVKAYQKCEFIPGGTVKKIK